MNGAGPRALTPLTAALLTLAVLLLGAGSADAADRNVSAAAAQYPVAAVQGTSPSQSPETGTAIPLGEETPGLGSGESLPEASPTPVVAQGGSGGGGGEERLPFTGYLVLPLLIGGVVLLLAGLTLRRRVIGQPA